MRKIKIGIIFGGPSSEYEVSCKSAAEILQHIDTTKFIPLKIGITKKGEWFLTDAEVRDIEEGVWFYNENNKKLNFEFNGINVVNRMGSNEPLDIDCLFPIIHGKFGEDGCIQGLLELLNIPYIGCGVAASAIGFDKALTKELVNSLNIEQADCLFLYKGKESIDTQIELIKNYFNNEYPLFIKPAREGSSIGITKIKSESDLEKGLIEGYKCDNKLLVEKGILGREVEVAILGTNNPIASDVGGILIDDFYSYDCKYGSDSAKTTIIKDVDVNVLNRIRKAAIDIYNKLESKSLSRVDFFLRADGSFVFNEINTMPGFTTSSMYPKLWAAKGISYKELITILIEDALKG